MLDTHNLLVADQIRDVVEFLLIRCLFLPFFLNLIELLFVFSLVFAMRCFASVFNFDLSSRHIHLLEEDKLRSPITKMYNLKNVKNLVSKVDFSI